ncbi:MAG: cation:proton antiporter domain-containing protein [Planctomycetota bacterium]|jgi:Kef-type K+ transport system membrane component KefB
MTESLNAILAQSEGINLIFLIGVAVLAGTVGARIIKLLHIPQIIGYIAIGVILGPLLKIIPAAGPEGAELFNLWALEVFNLFALGVIGFLIGGELERDIFVKFGKQVIAILLFEGGFAFLLVGTASFVALNYFYSWQTALAVGVVFGAICAATDPASTVSVLWEYKTRGPLTTMLTAVVALDDALALVLYIASVSLAGFLTGTAEAGFFELLLHSVVELVGSLALGFATGLMLREIVRRVDDDEKILVFSIGTIILTIGLAEHLEFDVILASMACGATLINLSPRRSLKSFEIVRRISPPIYILFFVIIGSRLNVSITGQIWLMAGIYVVCSIIGKTAGAYWGASYSKAAPTVRKYLGFCLYQQGTIAIALLIMASQRFEGEIEIRDMMLSVIIVGVFVLQFIGPLLTKIGVRKAGEVGMNITEEDLIKTHNVGDVMDAEAPVISAGMSLSDVIQFVGNTTSFYYSVVDKDKKLMGCITLDGIRNTFATHELNDWLIALDIMEPIIATVTPDIPLATAFAKTKKLDIEHLPVVVSEESNELVGVLNCRAVRRSLSAEVLARQKRADEASL